MSGSTSNAIDAAVARLATDVPPPSDLWPGIREAIRRGADEDGAGRLTGPLPRALTPPAALWPAIRSRIAADAAAGGVSAARSRPRGGASSGGPGARSESARIWGAAGIGIAATLVIGILIGRWSAGLDVGEPDPVARTASVTAPARRALPSEIATSEHLQQAETLLLLFESAPASGGELAESAEVLAARTRLLIDSRVGDDPEARAILLDLEYFLTQISRLADASGATETELARESIEGSTIVARLRQFQPELTLR